MKLLIIKITLSILFIVSYSNLNISAQSVEYNLEEKVSLLTDKELYIAGEKIFFYVRTYEAFWGNPIEFSCIAYVELYSQHKEAFVQAKVQILNSKGQGVLILPRNIPSGIYYLRAYTNYMKNDGCENFFTKKLKIVNPFVEPEEKGISYRSSEVHCNFYPEGGNLITGQTNKLTCQFIDENGTPLQVKARLVNDLDSLIQSESSNSTGIVNFNFYFEPDVKYRVQAVSSYGTFEKELIASGPEKLNLSLESLDEKNVLLSIQNGNNSSLNGYELWVSKGKNRMLFSDKIIPDGNTLKISRNDLLPGFQYIQIQNLSGKIVSSLGINNDITLGNAKFGLDKQQYTARSKAKIIIENSGGYSDVLILAKRKEANIDSQSNTINSELISNYSIRGFGYQELLMNGSHDEEYSGFQVSIPKQDNSYRSTYLPEIEGDIISGRVLDKEGNFLVGEEVIQSFNDSINKVQSYITDSLGKFFFHVFQEKSNSDLILRISEETPNAELNLDWEFYPEYITGIWEDFMLNEDEKELVKEAMMDIQVTDAYSEFFKIKDIGNKEDQVIKFYGEPTDIFYLADYIALPNIEEFLFEIVTWAVPVRKDGEKYIRIVSPQTNNFIGPTPLFLIDGIPFFNSEAVFNLKPEEVKSIAVFNEKYFYKDQIYDGILEIETKSGKAGNVKLPRNTYRYAFVPIQTSGNEYSIELPDDIESSIPVMKSTIYWNSQVELNENESTTIEFMLPDNYGEYLVKYIGLDKGGNYSVQVKEFEIVQ